MLPLAHRPDVRGAPVLPAQQPLGEHHQPSAPLEVAPQHRAALVGCRVADAALPLGPLGRVGDLRDPARAFELLERRVHGGRPDLHRAVRGLLDALHDPVSVHRLERSQQDQEDAVACSVLE